MASKRKVTMFHPEAGTLRCAPSAVRIHQRRGWHIEAEAETVTLASAGGGVLTTGTVFPPETFDDDVDDD